MCPAVGSINGKRRVTLGRAPLRQDRSQANQTTPRGHTSPTSTVPATGVLRSQRNGQKGGPILKHLEHLDGDETGTNPRPRDGEVLEGKTARNSSGQGTGGVSLNRKSSLASGLRKRKSDENGGGWSEWPAGAFGDPASDGAGRNEKENGNGFGDGSRFQTRNETQFGEGVSEEDCMGSKRPAQSELENGRKGGLADNPAAKAKGFSPSLIAREAKKGERWSGFGAAEDNRAGFVSFGTASERTYPSFGAAAGGLGTDLGTDLGSGRYGDRTYPPFAAATGSDEPGLGAGSERTYPQFGPGLRKDSPGEPSVEEREGFGGDSQGFEGFGEGFAGFGGASRGASGASADEGVAGFRGLRRPWSPPRPDFSSLEDEERSWRGGGFGSRAERGGGTEAGNGTERANGTERGRNGTETAHWMEATENGTERNGRGRSSWDEELEADGMRADGTGTGGTREGGTGADGSGASGSGAAEQDAVVRLLRERLPHYKPLDMLMREGGFDNEPIFIDYR